jgi:hypothetical protein
MSSYYTIPVLMFALLSCESLHTLTGGRSNGKSKRSALQKLEIPHLTKGKTHGNWSYDVFLEDRVMHLHNALSSVSSVWVAQMRWRGVSLSTLLYGVLAIYIPPDFWVEQLPHETLGCKLLVLRVRSTALALPHIQTGLWFMSLMSHVPYESRCLNRVMSRMSHVSYESCLLCVFSHKRQH